VSVEEEEEETEVGPRGTSTLRSKVCMGVWASIGIIAKPNPESDSMDSEERINHGLEYVSVKYSMSKATERGNYKLCMYPDCPIFAKQKL
jgi:hypothetical protein